MPKFRVEMERIHYLTHIVEAPNKVFAKSNLPHPNVRLLDIEEDDEEIETTVTEICSDDEHDWQEQPGEPPVDICSKCGQWRE